MALGRGDMGHSKLRRRQRQGLEERGGVDLKGGAVISLQFNFASFLVYFSFGQKYGKYNNVYLALVCNSQKTALHWCCCWWYF